MRWQLAFLNPEHYSLRQRLGLGLVIIILPLLLISSGGYLLVQYAVSVMEQSHEEIQYEMMPIIRLQAILLQAQMPPNDFLIDGEQDEIRKFDVIAAQLAGMFEKALQAPFEMEDKQFHVARAHELWSGAERLSGEILTLDNPVGNVYGAELMRRFDALALEAYHELEYVTVLGLGELASQHKLVHELHLKADVTLAVFLFGVSLAVVVGTLLLQRWIVAPLDVLRHGAEQLGDGKLDHRIPVSTRDEIGRVAETFNAMAESLMRDHEMLHSLAIHDPLTGLFNLKEFQQRLELEITRARRHARHIAVLMIDIDYFKRVNDRYGHPAGDAVIKEMADRIRSTMRPADVSARYGGEEFVAVLVETDASGAMTMAERLCDRVRSEEFQLGDSVSITVTISVGVAVFPPDAAKVDTLIAAADKALYAAKTAGRDHVAAHSAAGDGIAD